MRPSRLAWRGLLVVVLVCSDHAIAANNNIDAVTSLAALAAPYSRPSAGATLHKAFARAAPQLSVVAGVLQRAVGVATRSPQVQGAVEHGVGAVEDLASRLMRGGERTTEVVARVQSLLQMGITYGEEHRQIGTCDYRITHGFTLPTNNDIATTATAASAAATTVEDCAAAAEATPSAIAFTFSDGACRVVESIGEDVNEVNSGVCVRRGGCYGRGVDTQCAWLHLPQADIAAAMGAGKHVTDNKPATEGQCRSACEGDVNCIAFGWKRLRTAAERCMIYYQFSEANALASTAFCMRRMKFLTTPGKCYKGEKCKTPGEVVVPEHWGDVTLELSLQPPGGVNLSSVAVVAKSGRAEIPDLTIDSYGNFTLTVSTDNSPCQATSDTFLVDADEFHTFFAWQERFPPYSFPPEFILFRFRNSCMLLTLIALVLGVLVLGVLVAWVQALWKGRFRMAGAFVVVSLILFVAAWDVVHAQLHWKCFKQST